MSARPVDAMLAALERHGCKVSREGEGWRASCPSPAHAHGNRRNPALSITEGADGRVLLHCHAGCGAADVLGALGLEPAALFPDGEGKTTRGTEKRARSEQRPRYLPGEPPGKDGVTRFPYRDAEGRTVIYVRRIEGPEGKTFRQYHHDGKGWLAGLGPWKGRKRPLFRLPVILGKAALPVVLHEGEKAAVAAVKAGLHGVHSTTIGGAGNARHSDFAPLKGRAVFIVPDHDEPGEKHARQVAGLALAAGAESVRIVRLPDVPEKGDAVEWLEAGGTPEAWRKLLDGAAPFREGEKARSGELVRLADVKPERIRWLWPDRIAIGKLTMFSGDPGLGKSMLTAELAAHVTTGKARPVDGAPCPKGAALLLSAEDDLADTIRPRLDAAGADVSRVYALPMVCEIGEDGRERRRVPSLVDDLERIEGILAAHPEIILLTIDPVSAYLAGVDSHKNTDMRAVLSPWADMAARRGVAIVCITHLNKGTGAAMYRTAGSIAFNAAARASFVVAKSPHDESLRVVLPMKANLAPDTGGMAYRVEVAENGAPRIAWESEPVNDVNADEVLSWRAPDDEARTATSEAEEFLRTVLADGPVKAKDVQREAREAGISEKALRRARESLGVEVVKRGFQGAWVWSIPPQRCPKNAKDALSRNGASLGIFGEEGASLERAGEGEDASGEVGEWEF